MNKLLARHGENVLLHIPRMSMMLTILCTPILQLGTVDRGQGAEIFSTSPEVDSSPYNLLYQLDSWNI